jgi:hypothetical protein
MSLILTEPIGGWNIGNYATFFTIPGVFISATITGATKLTITASNLKTATSVQVVTNTGTFNISGTGKLKNNSSSIVKVGDISSPVGVTVIGAGQIKVKSV